MIAKTGSKVNSSKKVIRDKRGQAGGSFLDHPIVYVIILFGLAAIIGSVMMMITAETDKVVAPTMEFGSVSGESWVFDSCDNGTYAKSLAHDDIDSSSLSVYFGNTTYTETTDYTVNYGTGTVTAVLSGAFFPAQVTNESWAFNCTDNSTYEYNLSHANICSGIVLTNDTTTFTLNVDYFINTSAGILYNRSAGLIGGHPDCANYTDTLNATYTYQWAPTFSVDYDYTAGKWGTSYSNVVSGVQLGFSMYKLVALMGIMSIVLPMLFLMFARRRED